MKQHIVRFLHAGCLCLAVSLTSAFAQSSQLLTVDLPFAFEVNNQQFPAGHYKVSVEAGHPAVLLQDVKSKQAMYTISSPIRSEKTREVASLVFTRYNDRYFLSQIWMTGTDSGRELAPSRTERDLVRRWAKSAPKPDTEVVAALGPPK
jgi:hypothetical protein